MEKLNVNQKRPHAKENGGAAILFSKLRQAAKTTGLALFTTLCIAEGIAPSNSLYSQPSPKQPQQTEHSLKGTVYFDEGKFFLPGCMDYEAEGQDYSPDGIAWAKELCTEFTSSLLETLKSEGFGSAPKTDSQTIALTNSLIAHLREFVREDDWAKTPGFMIDCFYGTTPKSPSPLRTQPP